MQEFLANTGDFNAVVDYTELFASFAGEFLDLRKVNPRPICLHPDKNVGYAAGNAVSDSARSRGLNAIVYPSVRHRGGTCIAALWPHTVQSVAQGGVHRLTWSGSPEPQITTVAAHGKAI